jgi:hypothetical protein
MLEALMDNANTIGPVIFLWELLLALGLVCGREGPIKYIWSNVWWLYTNTITSVGYMACKNPQL